MQKAFFIAVLVELLLVGDFRFVKTVESEADMHFSDPLGNVYLVKGNTLRKITGTQSAGQNSQNPIQYTNAFLGNIFSVDVSDPLRLLLYYRDHNQVVWVDNFLTEIRSPVWLDAIGLDQAMLVCTSSQGGFWVLNGLNNQLQQLDVNLNLVQESASLNLFTGPDIQPAFMIEKNRSLYLNIPGTGILVFDRFGNYSKTLPVETPAEFQVTDSHIYFMKAQKLFSFDLKTYEISGLELPDDPAIDITGPAAGKVKAELQPGLLFLYFKGGFSVFRTSP